MSKRCQHGTRRRPQTICKGNVCKRRAQKTCGVLEGKLLPTWQDQIAMPALRPRLIFRFLPIAASAINQRSTIKHEDSTTFVFTGSKLVTKEFTQVKNGSRNLLICIYIYLGSGGLDFAVPTSCPSLTVLSAFFRNRFWWRGIISSVSLAF